MISPKTSRSSAVVPRPDQHEKMRAELKRIVENELLSSASDVANALLDKGVTTSDSKQLMKKALRNLITEIRSLVPVPDSHAEQVPQFTIPYTGGSAQGALRQATTPRNLN